MYDKLRGRSYESNVANVASERYFYDFPPEIVAEGADPQLIDKELSRMETAFADALAGFLLSVDEGRAIDARQRTVMAIFVATQALRTREHRVLGEQLARTILAPLQADGVAIDLPDTSLTQAVLIFHPFVRDVLIPVLFNHIWIVGQNDTPAQLYTSDSPVVRSAHEQDPFLSYAGLGIKGIEIALPLTPRHVLVLCERTSFAHLAERDGSTVTLNEDHVTYYNTLQVAESYRQVYCPCDDFSLAEEICDRLPDLRSPDRPRIITK